ncbi:mitochondria-eating protein isoform X2 [Xiphias gladius]|nr:mitochondria-eating protein isoform X2 [Xiphias gladius]
MQKMETQLCSTRSQLDSVRTELVDAQKELDETKSKSATTLLATEDEILQLKADLRSAHEQEEIYKKKLDALDDNEHQIRLLRDEVSYLNTEKAMLQERLVRSRSPSPLPRISRSSSPMRSESPTRAQLTNSSRHARLVSRFSDLYAVERLEAQTLLRRYIVDLEMVQKIIFIAVVESFKTAKLAYRQFKLRVRKTLSPSHFGPESLEDAAVDYIVRNLDLYDVQDSVNGVVNAMNVNPRISFPPEVDFVLISTLIRESCRVAFAMQTLDPPLDLAFASDGELYNDNKYCRSYDSEFTAPLVMYHVWPALVEGNAVIVKGEAVTRRGALWSRSQSRSRSASPARSRSLSPTRSLAFNSKRSLSPERLTASRL